MKTQRLLVIALLLSASALCAEPIKLKVADALALNAALSSLDGQQKVVPQGEAPAKLVVVPYEFSGKIRWTIAQNLTALAPSVKSADEARNALVKQVGGESGTIAATDSVRVSKFTAAYNEILTQPLTVELTKVKLEELKLDANPIPATLLSALTPIVTP
jgi:hypothetical protein